MWILLNPLYDGDIDVLLLLIEAGADISTESNYNNLKEILKRHKEGKNEEKTDRAIIFSYSEDLFQRGYRRVEESALPIFTGSISIGYPFSI